jgi:L-lactate dehydrogenase complex protein LldG
MTSRENILQSIRENKPALSPLPDVPMFERSEMDLIAHFKEILQFVGGEAIELTDGESLNDRIEAIYPDMKNIISNVEGIRCANIDIQSISDPHDLRDVDLVIIKGEFGVSENAAIWVSERNLVHRVLPFITQHAVIVLDKSQLVWNMHQAYQRAEMQAVDGFGVFISGPSKTADIEQSLVIGAHGSRSLVVFLV